MNGAEQAAPDGPPAVNLRMLLREEHMTTGREGATLRVHELDAAQLLVFWEVIPALGRDVLVRIGVVRPDVDDAHALWERMAVSGVEEWRRLYAVTGAAQAMLILNELRAQWRDVGKELQRRTKAAPIGVLYTRAVAEDEDEALRQLGQWLRPWPTDEPPPDVQDKRQDRIAGLVKRYRDDVAVIAGATFTGGPLDGAAYRALGPAPDGWEQTNQHALDTAIQARLSAHWPALSGDLDRGGRIPFAARDADRNQRKRAGAKKRQGETVPLAEPAAGDTMADAAVARTLAEAQKVAHEDEEARRTAKAMLASAVAAQAKLRKGQPLRALEALADGATKAEAAAAAGISRPTLDAYLARLRGHLQPE